MIWFFIALTCVGSFVATFSALELRDLRHENPTAPQRSSPRTRAGGRFSNPTEILLHVIPRRWLTLYLSARVHSSAGRPSHALAALILILLTIIGVLLLVGGLPAIIAS